MNNSQQEFAFITAAEIDVQKLNPEMKGVKVQVKPLFDLNNHGKQVGFALNMKMPNEAKFSRTKYAPFLFETEVEAETAAGKINVWSVTK